MLPVLVRLAAATALAVGVAGAIWRPAGPAAATDAAHTRHRNPDGSPRYTNRLARESSPYLRQHAHNPVDWYPWGDEAFAKARREGKPIFLSIGYSSCHWCHVMEEESFDDEEVAAVLNERYVAIKVDREQRPDVDAVYMTAVQAMGQGGGWPLTVWLTPDARPFYGGTYFPPRAGARGARFGLIELLERLDRAYHENPQQVAAAAADVVGRLERAATPPPGAALPGSIPIQAAVAALRAEYDAEHGGFGDAPKFPSPATLELLLRYQRRAGDADALDMVTRTLDAMAAGGIQDQLAGGFHRYATDAAWRVPHFEKMLYDNALLATVYLEASQAAGRPDLADVARRTLDWLRRDMRAPGGGFHAAVDADSEGEEGRFYLWTREEITSLLDGPNARVVAAHFDLAPPGVLHISRPLDVAAADAGLSIAAARTALETARRRLLTARGRRVPPHVDRKVIVAWNGLAISAFAQGASVLGQPAYREDASRAAEAILGAARSGRLPRSLVDGIPRGSGYLEDYACFEAGLLDLFETTGDPRWLEHALALQAVLDAHFRDSAGGYFRTADDAEALLVREKPDFDGAEPSGNSVALQNLLRLHELTGDDRFRQTADGLLRAFGPARSRPPALRARFRARPCEGDRRGDPARR
jgi:uncharacterized protein YyaL (SSP411 family)